MPQPKPRDEKAEGVTEQGGEQLKAPGPDAAERAVRRSGKPRASPCNNTANWNAQFGVLQPQAVLSQAGRFPPWLNRVALAPLGRSATVRSSPKSFFANGESSDGQQPFRDS
jgi:hypothetical protein